MAYGPDKLRPVGTQKRRDIERIVSRIDQYIASSEKSTLFIPPSHIGYYGFETYTEDLINIYRDAGWRCVYISKYGNLVLSNDLFHGEVILAAQHEGWWTKIKSFLNF